MGRKWDARGARVGQGCGKPILLIKGKKGDIIIEAGQTAINSLRDVKDKIEKARREGRKSILLLMERQSGIGFVAIRIGQG